MEGILILSDPLELLFNLLPKGGSY